MVALNSEMHTGCLEREHKIGVVDALMLQQFARTYSPSLAACAFMVPFFLSSFLFFFLFHFLSLIFPFVKLMI